MALPTSRRTASMSGSARLSLSVGKSNTTPATSGRHPLKHNWSISSVHRPPGAKVDYEKEIRKAATFGSIESFLQLYSHMTPPSELPPVTDFLVFLSRIGRPGVWEEMSNGGKFTIRLLHAVTPLLFETLLLSMVGDQFDDADAVVGLVLSVRQGESILSLWVEEEGESVRSGALKEKVISLLGLPAGTMCEYRSNRALLDAASSVKATTNHATPDGEAEPRQNHGGRFHHHRNDRADRSDRTEREDSERPERERGEGWNDRPPRQDRRERLPTGDSTDRPERAGGRAWGGGGGNGFRDRGVARHDGHANGTPGSEREQRGWEGRNGWSRRTEPRDS